LASEVVITFACSDWKRQEYERLVELFHQTHPYIEVQLLSRQSILGDERGENAIRRLAASADTFAYPGGLLPRHTREGLVKDLTPFIEADPTFDASDFYQGLLEQFRWDDGTWALPAKVYLAFIFYDKRAFEEAGLSPPRPGWTFEEFTQAAQRLTRREGDRILRYGFINPSPDIAIPLVLGRAGTWADPSVAPPLPKLDDLAIVEAVEWYTDLALKYSVMPNPAKFDEQELAALIIGGKAAMWIGHSGQQFLYTHIYPHLELGIAPPPEGKLIVNWKWASGYAMSAGTAHPQESWEWLSFLTHQPLRESMPPRPSLFEASKSEFDEEMWEVYSYILDKPQVTLSPDLPIVDPLLGALDSIFAEEKGVEEALAEAQAQALDMVEASAEEAATPIPLIAIPTPEPRDERITIAFCPNHALLDEYRLLVREFHKQHPEINVELVISEALKPQYLAEECDCFAAHSGFGTQRLPYYQHILNLQPFLDADPDVSLDDFYPPFLEVFRREGDLWGLPLEGGLQLLLYNKDLFDEAGVEYPQPGWRLEDFLEKAVALTSGQGENKVYGYVPFGDPLVGQFLLFGELGVTIIDATAQPPRPQLDNPAMVSALRWYTNLTLEYGVMPIFKMEEVMQDFERVLLEQWGLISASRAAMWIGSPSTYFERVLPPRIGNVPLPLGQRKMGMREHGIRGYVISAKAAYPQACWEWIKFVSDHSAVVTRGLPARRSVAESPEYRSQVGEEVAEALLFTLEHIDPSLDAVEKENPWLTVLYYWVTEAYDRVLEGADAEKALADAQAKAEDFIACLGEDIISADRAQYWACAQEVDPEVKPPPDFRQE
jgi:ABC-type glycerol-3-phosphate transport system substrate-binding protein